MQDVDDFLVRQGLSLNDYLDDRRPAVLDEDHMAAVNYERFFFADEENRRRFEADPLTLCGTVTDPVSKSRFVPRPGARTLRREGILWVFASDATYERLRRDPKRYQLPGWRM